MADEHLLSAGQQELSLAVVEALNHDCDHPCQGARRDHPPPDSADIEAIVRIVELDWIGYTPGEKPAVILARLLDRIEETLGDH
ncbi:hypothetical protein [Nocardia rhizosphaerihabitans]|uniref:hypothetical protein n=1 Tax=Nocardia rhizosphaerihabitans TaxID=1691570 RepID=UPI00166C0839|nr:hypothetical protein [Nocardia rhizosphaerihabitans]